MYLNIQGVAYQLQQKLQRVRARGAFCCRMWTSRACAQLRDHTQNKQSSSCFSAGAWSVYERFASGSRFNHREASRRRQMRRFATFTDTQHIAAMQKRSKYSSRYKSIVKGARNYFLARFGDLSLIGLLVSKSHIRTRGSMQNAANSGDDASFLNGLTGKADLWPQLVVIFAKGPRAFAFHV